MARKVWVPAVSGPLAAYAAGYGSWLRAQSYSPSAISDRLWQFDQLSRWLDDEGLAVGEVTAAVCERFAASRHAAGLVTLVAPQSVTLPVEYLRAVGVMATPVSPVAHGRVEELLADYSRFLLIERALSPHTVFDAYVPAARLLLVGVEGPGGLRLDRLAAADVSMFLARSVRIAVCRERVIWCPRCARSCAICTWPGGSRRRWCGRCRRSRICGIVRCRGAWNRRR
jgi:hypothetical protein